YPSPNYPSPNYPSPNYPSPNYPSPNYPSPNYPSPNYPSPNYPTPNYPPRNYPNRLRPNRSRRDCQQAVLAPVALKQHSGKVYRDERTKRTPPATTPPAGRHQHCQLQFRWPDVTMNSRDDGTNTLVASAIWAG
ncbi:hypothetical protein ACFQ3P_00005, partial [Paraburkholderia sabiae]|uniref:hypothetical protein n=1 Tax=Paraburkholderia sabiae TaxID=273251 RepID=UPI00362E1B02